MPTIHFSGDVDDAEVNSDVYIENGPAECRLLKIDCVDHKSFPGKKQIKLHIKATDGENTVTFFRYLPIDNDRKTLWLTKKWFKAIGKEYLFRPNGFFDTNELGTQQIVWAAELETYKNNYSGKTENRIKEDIVATVERDSIFRNVKATQEEIRMRKESLLQQTNTQGYEDDIPF